MQCFQTVNGLLVGDRAGGEALLDDREDYLVIVGTLHLVGKDSLIDLLENKGHKVTQH